MARKDRVSAPTPAARTPKLEGKKPYGPDKSAEYLAKRERRNERGGKDAPEGEGTPPAA